MLRGIVLYKTGMIVRKMAAMCENRLAEFSNHFGRVFALVSFVQIAMSQKPQSLETDSDLSPRREYLLFFPRSILLGQDEVLN